MPEKKSSRNTFKPNVKIVKDEMVPFTRQFAEWYCELPKFDAERSITQKRAVSLQEQMRDSKWTEGHGEISVARFPDGALRRLNGQHRCWARFTLEDENFKPLIRFVIYAIKDEDEYRALYIRFDNPNTHFVRSSAHLIHMALYDTEEFEGVSKEVCTNLARGYRGWQHGFNNAQRKCPIEQIAEKLRGEYNLRAKHAAEIIVIIVNNKKALSHLARAPVFSAIFETMKYVSRAREFWTRVIDGLFDRKNDPAKILSDYLYRTGIGNKVRTRDVIKIATLDEMYAVCVKCFNFHKNGKGLTKTPPSIGPRPVAR
jgi:hypothetical protein